MFKKTDIKGLVCGEEKFFKTLKENFIQKDVYKEVTFINSQGGLIRLIDTKSKIGQLYMYEPYRNLLKPAKEEVIDGFTIKVKSRREKDNIDVKYSRYVNKKLDNDYSYQEKINLQDMTFKSQFDGQQLYDYKCEYVPVPDDLKIEKK